MVYRRGLDTQDGRWSIEKGQRGKKQETREQRKKEGEVMLMRDVGCVWDVLVSDAVSQRSSLLCAEEIVVNTGR